MRERLAPTTFGQLSVLRSLEHMGRDAQAAANEDEIFIVPPGVDSADAASAWLHLVSENESLRTVYRDMVEPKQVVLAFRPTKLARVELEEATVAAARAAAEELVARPFSIDAEEPWRAFVAEYEGRPCYVVSVLHHVVADNVACRELRRQFAGYFAGASLERQPQPRELAAEQQSALQWRRRTIEHWLHEWNNLVDVDRAGTDDGSERIQAALYSRVGMLAAQRISTKLRISLQSVLLGVAYLMLFELKGRSSATIALMAGNRFDKRWNRLVSSMNQLAPCTVSAVPGTHPEDFLRSVYAASLNAYLHGSYSVDELREQLSKQGHYNPDPMRFDCWFNFMGESDEQPADDDTPGVTTIEWQEASRSAGPAFYLLVSTGRGMRLALRASRLYCDTDLVSMFLTSFEAALVDIADGAPASIKEVDRRPLRSVSASVPTGNSRARSDEDSA